MNNLPPLETATQKPRVAYLSQLFDPEPTFKGQNFVNGLEERGFKIEVITGFPNYPGGRIYDGYKIRPLIREKKGDTEITRLAMYPSHDKSALKRILTYCSFMITSFLYLTFKAKRPDLIYVYYPALSAGIAAAATKFFRKTPILLDVQDMWPDSLGSSGMMSNTILLKLANAACNLLYRQVDHILVLSPGFKALLVERGVPEGKISIVYNWADESPTSDDTTLPEGFQPEDGFRVLFAGNIGVVQQLDIVVEAAAQLQLDHPDCIFYLMGDGIDKKRLESRVKELRLNNVRFLPRVALNEVQRFLTASDALLVHLADDPLFRITIPSKTQAYLYAGRPILIGLYGDASDLVRDADAGYAFPPGDPAALADCVGRLITDGPERREEIGRNASRFYKERLRRSNGIDATAELINRFRKGMSN